MWPKTQIHDGSGWRLPSWIFIKHDLWVPVTFKWPNLSAHQIWCNYLHWRPRYGWKYISKTAAASILYFQKSAILGPSNPCIANICKPNLAHFSQEVAEIHLFVICYSTILDQPRGPLDGLYLPCQLCNDLLVWCDQDSAIFSFDDLAGKRLFTPLLGTFWGIIGTGWSNVDPQWTHSHFLGFFYLFSTFCKNWSRNKITKVQTERETGAHKTVSYVCLIPCHSYGTDNKATQH